MSHVFSKVTKMLHMRFKVRFTVTVRLRHDFSDHQHRDITKVTSILVYYAAQRGCRIHASLLQWNDRTTIYKTRILKISRCGKTSLLSIDTS